MVQVLCDRSDVVCLLRCVWFRCRVFVEITCASGVLCLVRCHVFTQVLAKKMTVLYRLSKEQLSKQYHYDFGLRALKSVLVMAGELKRSSPELDEVCVSGKVKVFVV